VKVAVTGATGVIGTSAVHTLVAAGHDVVGLARTADKATLLETLGATAVLGDIFDHDALTRVLRGCDAVCNVATHIPVGYAAARPGAWRENDRLRTEGVRRVVEAARETGVRRLVQESVSFLYADNGDDWVTEDSPVDITAATEPASVGESHVQRYRCDSRHGVVLRFGTIVGDDGLTRWLLRSARHGRAVGVGRPESWAHLVHTDDLGPAVLAALYAPSGVYNVGTEPVRRAEVVRAYATAAGHDSGTFMGPVLQRLAGARLEPLTRSLRVSSEHFMAQTGWTPRRAQFDASWFDVVAPEPKAVH
jgi:nucleoside-diphosphate-sugar epimerase